MKTAELQGAELDYWTARAEGLAPVIRKQAGKVVCLVGWLPHSPSENWALGGPIIEREHIAIVRYLGHWAARLVDLSGAEQQGETALVAAMRAYVASKFGDDVMARSADAL